MPVRTKERHTEAVQKKAMASGSFQRRQRAQPHTIGSKEQVKPRITKKKPEEQPAIPWREAFAHLSDEDIAGAILRDFRETAKLTQTKLSLLTGIPQSHISAIERGKLFIGKERAKKFATVFDCDYRMFL
jgi:ribosome-binding protein aMBF1 (putative translation factor)